MRILYTIFLCLFGFTACTQDPITINNGAPTVTINNGPPTITINYTVPDPTETFLQWEEIGPEVEFYNDIKGIRKIAGTGNGYAETNSAWAKQYFVVGDTLIMKVSTTPNLALWVYLDSDKYSFSAADVTFYDYALILGVGSTSNTRAYDGTGALGSGNTAISAGDLLSIVYVNATTVKYEQSTDGGNTWNTIYTSAQDPADTIYAGVKIFHPEAGVDEIYKNRPVAYDYPTPLAASHGVMIGNSTMGTYGSSTEPISYFMRTAPEVSAGNVVDNLAVSGHIIAQQQAAWEAYADKANVDYIIVMVGRNNCGSADAASVIIGKYQVLIDTINAQKKSGAKVIVAAMLPSNATLDDDAQAKWVLLNEAIMGGGATPITGVDARVETHSLALNDGNDNLIAQYDLDGTHENNAGRYLIATYWRAVLAALNIIDL